MYLVKYILLNTVCQLHNTIHCCQY